MILENINEPLTAAMIKQRVELIWPEENISMALKAMARDGEIKVWQMGHYVHKGYHDQEGVKPRPHVKPKPKRKSTVLATKHVSVDQCKKGHEVWKPDLNTDDDFQRRSAAQTKQEKPMPEINPVEERIEKHFDEMREKLNREAPTKIKNLELKQMVIKQLSTIVSPDIANVLEQIDADYSRAALS